MNVQMRVYQYTYSRNMHTHPLVHIHQKTKIAPKIAAKIASVNRPLICCGLWVMKYLIKYLVLFFTSQGRRKRGGRGGRGPPKNL